MAKLTGILKPTIGKASLLALIFLSIVTSFSGHWDAMSRARIFGSDLLTLCTPLQKGLNGRYFTLNEDKDEVTIHWEDGAGVTFTWTFDIDEVRQIKSSDTSVPEVKFLIHKSMPFLFGKTFENVEPKIRSIIVRCQKGDLEKNTVVVTEATEDEEAETETHFRSKV